MPRRSVVGSVVLISCATSSAIAPPADLFSRECHDSTSCQQLYAEQARAVALAVAAEPAVVRLPVEQVPGALFLRPANQVLVGLPAVTALDPRTGAELWSVPEMRGSLTRAGRWLVSSFVTKPSLQATVQFLEPNTLPRQATSCALTLALPKEASELTVTPFDRAGVPYVWWVTSRSWNAGVRPPPGFDDEARRAAACGVVKVDPKTCATTPVATAEFAMPGSACDSTRVPAIAASAPPPHQAAGVIWLHSAFASEPKGQCGSTQRQMLEARTEDSTLLWSRLLSESAKSCPP